MEYSIEIDLSQWYRNVSRSMNRVYTNRVGSA